MSLFSKQQYKISFGENDNIVINSGLSYAETIEISEMATNQENNIDVLKKIIISMSSDGKEINPTDENLKKLPMSHILKVMTELHKCMGVTEELKKNSEM